MQMTTSLNHHTSTTQPSIDELYKLVREHPDFVFGTIFVAEDSPDGEVPADFRVKSAEAAITVEGNEFIEMFA